MQYGVHSIFQAMVLQSRLTRIVSPQHLSLLLTALLASGNTLAQQEISVNELLNFSLEQLASLQITSVSRHEESISHAPASIYVITSDDIRRSGATTLPEILRLAPNLQVARIDSVQYAITARGFNNSVGNKLLVLIDGRTVYTSLFSGVFWEMQDTMLEDIDRIEVISGPGAALWGANAVNGVINVISKSAAQTTSTLISAGAGDNERSFAARTGAETNNGWQWRAYAKGNKWENSELESGAAALDNWTRKQIGFRADSTQGDNSFTVQGDAFKGESEQRGSFGTMRIPAIEVSGMNLLARWNRQLSADSDFHVQAYWNHNERKEFVLFSPDYDIFDLEFQHSFFLKNNHLLWGGGYRYGQDDVDAGIFTALEPDSRNLDWQNIYIQDEIALHNNLSLTAGLKLEWNDYTGMENLPSLRLGWTVSEQQFLWASVSRAVRAPSRFDRDTYFPQTPPFIVAGGPNFVSEVAKVYETGYRGLFNKVFQLSATLYYHDWDKLRSGTPAPLPTYLVNGIEGNAWGLETWMNWQLTPTWRLGGGLSTLHKDLHFRVGNNDTVGINNATLHNDPDYQWTLRSSTDLGPHFRLDFDLRKVAALTVEPVPAYTELNARFAWTPSTKFEVSLTGSNLLDKQHAEFGAIAARSLIERSLMLGFRWTP